MPIIRQGRNAELSMYKNARLKMYIFDFPCILQLYME